MPALVISSLVGAVSAASVIAAADGWIRSSRAPAVLIASASLCLIASSVLHLVPAIEAGRADLFAWTAIGFAGVVLMRAALSPSRADPSSGGRAILFSAGSVLAAHSAIEGVILAVSASHNGVGVAALGLILHEAPEAVIAFGLLRKAGFDACRAASGGFALAGLTTIAGVLGGDAILTYVAPPTLEAIFFVTLGGLLRIGLAMMSALVGVWRNIGLAAAGALSVVVAQVAPSSSSAGHTCLLHAESASDPRPVFRRPPTGL